MSRTPKTPRLRSTKEEVKRYETLETTHKLAFTDVDFLVERKELRPLRLQLELLKPELLLNDHGIEHTIVFFGSARLPDPEIAEQRLLDAEEALTAKPDDPSLQQQLKHAQYVLNNSRYLPEARKLARIISEAYGSHPKCKFVVTTGGGPSFMEAANRGAQDAERPSVSFNVMLPHEQFPNPHITPELTFQFHYFAVRKMHFFIRAQAMIAFPGGFGTCDELFDALTLIQTQKMDPLPILLFNERYWRRVLNFDAMVEEGTISAEDLALMQYVETADEAWQIIKDYYSLAV